jgi:hypothetical protein
LSFLAPARLLAVDLVVHVFSLILPAKRLGARLLLCAFSSRGGPMEVALRHAVFENSDAFGYRTHAQLVL